MKPFLVSALIVVGVAAGWIAVGSLYTNKSASPKRIQLVPVTHPKYEEGMIDWNIAYHEQRTRRDPEGAIGWNMLCGAYLARARESDSDVFAWKAEDAARESLKQRRKMNAAAANHLVSALLEQHRFQDAYLATFDSLKIEPKNRGALRLQADCLIELGRYDEAQMIIEGLPDLGQDDDQAIAILARLAGLKGDHQKAISLYERGERSLKDNGSIPETTIAWYQTKIAGEYEQLGDLAKAKKIYEEALKLNPRSYKITLGLGRIAMAEKRYSDAIKWAKDTLPIANSLEAYSMMGDAYAALGDKAKAQENFAHCRDMYRDECANFDGKGKGGSYKVKPIDRQFSTFAASHRMFQAEALEAAKRDVANRPDGKGLDNLGWLQWQLGMKSEAIANLEKAANSGQVDPKFAQHLQEASA